MNPKFEPCDLKKRTKVFSLRFLQARDPSWVGRPFFARFDPKATWFDKLRPAFGESAFFFEAGMEKFKQSKKPQAPASALAKTRLPMVHEAETV